MKALLVQVVEGQFVSSVCPDVNDLALFMAARGYEQDGLSCKSRMVREVLHGQPTFKGLCGPCWGGEDTPLRYETWEAHRIIST